MTSRSLLQEVARHPGIYGPESLAAVAALVDGLDAGLDGALLDGFAAWIEKALSIVEDEAWYRSILRVTAPTLAWPPALDTGECRRMTAAMFRVLDAFFDSRGRDVELRAKPHAVPVTDVLRARPWNADYDTFESVVGFVTGYQMAFAEEWLGTFRRWLILCGARGSNLAWDGLILLLAFPGRDVEPSTPEEHQVAIAKQFEYLEEFRHIRATPNGIAEIHRAWEAREAETRRTDPNGSRR